ncbi:hypothetical protein SAMN05216311_109189 [Chitinophaga sp. CF418]|nr:hypothetical protein SAMN05216311_109189 [Chitinophaga sp. CF418]
MAFWGNSNTMNEIYHIAIDTSIQLIRNAAEVINFAGNEILVDPEDFLCHRFV